MALDSEVKFFVDGAGWVDVISVGACVLESEDNVGGVSKGVEDTVVRAENRGEQENREN